MTDNEYQRLKDRRYELCSLLAGYAFGAMESIAESNQISINVQKRVEANLAYMRPLMARIWELGELTKLPPDDMDDEGKGKVNG